MKLHELNQDGQADYNEARNNEFHASKKGIGISFLRELDAARAEGPYNYSANRWNYEWLGRYCSDRWKLNSDQGVEEMTVRSATPLPDRKTVQIVVGDLRRVMQLMTNISIRTAARDRIDPEISHSIRALADEPGPNLLGKYD